MYKYNASSVELELSKFVATTGYEVKNLKSILKLDVDSFDIPDTFMSTFVSTAISSARGMLAYRLSGTILADFYLPLVDTRDFLNNIKPESVR